jgi:hypothetical protein
MTIALTSLQRAGDAYIITLMQDPDGKVDELFETYHTPSLARIFCQNASQNIVRGNKCLIHNYEPLPTPKINQLVIPTGSTRWSYCMLLADDSIKDAIYAACDNGSTPMNLIMGTPIGNRNEKDHAITLTVYALPPRRLSPETIDTGVNNLWVIPVVDERYYWQFRHTDALSESLLFSEIETPDELVDEMLDLTGVICLNVGVNTAHTALPVCRNENDRENLPIVMDSIFAHFGQRLVVDIGSWNDTLGRYDEVLFSAPPGGNTRYAVIDGLNSVSVFNNSVLGKLGLRKCTWGGGGDSLSYSASAENNIIGPPLLVAGGMQSTSGGEYAKYASAPESVDIQLTAGEYVNKTPGSEYVTVGGNTAIWRTEFETVPPSQQQAQIGRDYFYQFYRQFDYTFAGVQPWQQGYFDDYMVIRQTWNPRTRGYDAYTRVCSRQPNMIGDWVPTQTRLQGIMEDDMPAAVNTKRDPSTAQVKVLRKKSNGDLQSTKTIYTLTNRFKNISINKGTYVKFEFLDGEWQPYAADCPSDESSSSSESV